MDEIESLAKIAADNFNAIDIPRPETIQQKDASKKIQIVPDILNSGIDTSRYSLIEFHGKNCTKGASLITPNDHKSEKMTANVIENKRNTKNIIENTNTPGKKWFDMVSTPLTEEKKRDILLIKMRNYLDPKRFYKSSDHKKGLPKYFQVGTVIEGSFESKSSRMTRKERKATFTEEIMSDKNITGYAKRKFNEIQVRKKQSSLKHKKKYRY